MNSPVAAPNGSSCESAEIIPSGVEEVPSDPSTQERIDSRGKGQDMRIGLISTRRINIGDEFIRDGIVHCLGKIFPSRKVELLVIHKHSPFDFYKVTRPLNGVLRHHLSASIESKVVRHWFEAVSRRTILDGSSGIVQCGAPVFWRGMGQKGSWEAHLWSEFLPMFKGKIPIVNLGGGTCYDWRRRDDVERQTTQREIEFINQIVRTADFSSFRDQLAASLARKFVGGSYPTLPCPAILAPRLYEITKRGRSSFVLVSYMKAGGHYDFGDATLYQGWDLRVKKLVEYLMEQKEEVKFICHNRAEAKDAGELGFGTRVQVVLPKSRRDYVHFAENAKYCVGNRMHAILTLAGMGVPGLAIGTDTRMLMVKQVELPIMELRDASPENILDIVEDFRLGAQATHSRLLELAESAFEAYSGWCREMIA